MSLFPKKVEWSIPLSNIYKLPIQKITVGKCNTEFCCFCLYWQHSKCTKKKKIELWLEFSFKRLWLDHYCSDYYVTSMLYVWQQFF